jgi:nitroreductase
MEFQQVVQKRRMVRAFREAPLDRTVVERILANGNRAPSAGFTQGYGSWCWRVLPIEPVSGRRLSRLATHWILRRWRRRC